MVKLTALLKGDKRTIAQTISIVENGGDNRMLKQIFKHTGAAYHVVHKVVTTGDRTAASFV